MNDQKINNPDTPIPQSDVITQVTLPYYLYSGGKLKKVEREEPDKNNFIPHLATNLAYIAAVGKWDEYLNSLPAIEVHEDLKKVFKEGEKYYEGTNFEIKYKAQDGDFRKCSDEFRNLEHVKGKLIAIPLPVDPEESQEAMWEEVYMIMVREWMGSTYKGKATDKFYESVKSKYTITRNK